MGWSCLSVLNLFELQHFLRTQLHLVGLICHKTQGRPLWKIPWTQMWREALRDESASCEKEHVYCVWHMTFKKRGGGKGKNIKAQKSKCHREDKGKEKTGNRWWLVLSQLFHVLLSHNTKKRSNSFSQWFNDQARSLWFELWYQMLYWTRM